MSVLLTVGACCTSGAFSASPYAFRILVTWSPSAGNKQDHLRSSHLDLDELYSKRVYAAVKEHKQGAFWTLRPTHRCAGRLAWADKAASMQDIVMSVVHAKFAGHPSVHPNKLKGIVASRTKRYVLFYVCEAIQCVCAKHWRLARLHVSEPTMRRALQRNWMLRIYGSAV